MPEPRIFESAGRQVSRRLCGIGVIRALNVSVSVLAVILLLGFAVSRSLGRPVAEWTLAGAIIAGWSIAVAAFLWFRRVSPFRALARWDDVSGGKSTLASAEFFEAQTEELTPGEELHLRRARKVLNERRGNLSRDLPLPRLSWTWLGLPVVLAFLATPFLHRNAAGEDRLITEAMADRAADEAANLAQQRADLDRMKGLLDGEDKRGELQALEDALEDTAEMLGEAGDKTAREVLEELEARARAAEKLAEKLGLEDDAWASDEMLAEMAGHADTADLAAAIQDRSAKISTGESDKLAEKLADPKLTVETRERLETALGRTMEKATDADRRKPVGEHVGNASGKLAANQAKPAAQDFRNLADHFRDVERRQRAQNELKELAEQLRRSGNEIAQSQLQPMQQLGQDGRKPPQGAQNLAHQPVPQVPPAGPQGMPQTLPVPGPQNRPNPGPGMQNVPVPGMQGKPGQPPPGQQLGMAPVPGKPPKPGQNPNSSGLMAPVPGQAPGASMPGAMLGGAGNSAAGAPGLEAGFGTAEMGANPTEAMTAHKDGVVDAQINEDGESAVKTVQGGVRREAAQRERQAQAAEFIAVEEEALDEQALPAARREQVLRYFTALRQQFEENEK